MARAQAASEKETLSHNLLGQRLGRKGRDTRERIIAATERLLADPGAPISLSAVAREASLGMTTLYLYFSDLPELLLAVLAPITATAEESYIGQLRTHWPDEALGERCQRFVEAFHAFWVRHSRILHLRNAYADNNDERMRQNRIGFSSPVIELLVKQMEGGPGDRAMGTVLLTAIERVINVTTADNYHAMLQEDPEPHVRNLLRAEARLLELAIADARAAARSARASAATKQ